MNEISLRSGVVVENNNKIFTSKNKKKMIPDEVTIRITITLYYTLETYEPILTKNYKSFF